MERRLTMNPDGTTSGSLIKKQDQEKVVIGNSVAQAAIGGVINGPVQTALGDYLQTTQATPLTAEQRISELKKKINEYKSLLNVVTDTAAKLFFNQLLINIEKDLGEILVEVKKKPVQQAPVYPVPPSYPYQPGITLGPGPTWIGGKSPSVLDPLPGLGYVTTSFHETPIFNHGEKLCSARDYTITENGINLHIESKSK